eukprot:scaffold4264_cov116-Isochrysis_galbana.AAC.13
MLLRSYGKRETERMRQTRLTSCQAIKRHKMIPHALELSTFNGWWCANFLEAVPRLRGPQGGQADRADGRLYVHAASQTTSAYSRVGDRPSAALRGTVAAGWLAVPPILGADATFPAWRELLPPTWPARRWSKKSGIRMSAAPHTVCRQFISRRFHMRKAIFRFNWARASTSLAHMRARTCRRRA